MMVETDFHKALSVDDMLEYQAPEQFSAWQHLDRHFRPHRGMICTVTGSPGSGKSRWSMHFAMQMARQYNHRTAILSMEMLPVFVGRCLRSYTNAWNCKQIEQLVKQIMPYGDQQPTLDWVMRYARRCSNLDWLIIDPWNQLERSEKYKSAEQVQKDSLQELAHLANRQNLGIMIVTHPTKSIQQDDGSIREPTYYDIAGSAHWANRSDYVLCLRRNLEEGTTKFTSLKVRHQEDDLMPGSVNMRLSDKGLYVPV